MTVPVHLSDWASQPDVHIKCMKRFGTPAWEGTKQAVKGLPEGVHALDMDGHDEGVLYTFDEEKVTCTECKGTEA